MARLLGGLLVLSAAACSRQEAPAAQAPAAATGPITIDIARVVEQPLDVQLSLPGELVAYESVAVHPRVAGFVKAVAVDRGSVVRQGDLLVTLDAPEVVAQRAEAQSKRQAAEAQLAAARAKADADAARSTVSRRRRPRPAWSRGTMSPSPERPQRPAAVRSSPPSSRSRPRDRPRRRCRNSKATCVSRRHSLASSPSATCIPARWSGRAGGDAAPMVRVVDQRRLRLVVPVPEAYTAEPDARRIDALQGHRISRRRRSPAPWRVSRKPSTSRRARWRSNWTSTTQTAALAPGTFCQVRWPVRRTGPSLFVPTASVALDHGSHLRRARPRRQGRVGRRDDRLDRRAADRSVRRPGARRRGGRARHRRAQARHRGPAAPEQTCRLGDGDHRCACSHLRSGGPRSCLFSTVGRPGPTTRSGVCPNSLLGRGRIRDRHAARQLAAHTANHRNRQAREHRIGTPARRRRRGGLDRDG